MVNYDKTIIKNNKVLATKVLVRFVCFAAASSVWAKASTHDAALYDRTIVLVCGCGQLIHNDYSRDYIVETCNFTYEPNR